MRAKDEYLINLLSNSQTKYFVIPTFQRSYVWEYKKQVKTLIDDLKNFIELNMQGDYCLGSLIIEPQQDRRFTKLNLIDGQQRITTLYLMLKALEESLNTTILEEQEIKITIKNIFKKESSIQDIVARVDNVNVLNKILKESIIYSDEEKETTFFKNFVSMKKEFNKWKTQDKLDFYNYGISQLKVAIIELSSNENPYLIYESFNSKGKSLSSSELIKNFIMMDSENLESGNEEILKIINFVFYELNDTKVADQFFRQILAYRTGRLSSEKSLYMDFKKFFEDQRLNSLEAKIKWFNELRLDLMIWKYINNNLLNDMYSSKENNIALPLLEGQLMNFYSIIHVIIKRNCFINSNNEIEISNWNDVKWALHYLTKLVVYRTLATKFGRVESNRTWSKLACDLYSENQGEFRYLFSKFIIDKLENTPEKYRMPNDVEVFEVSEPKTLYSSTSGQNNTLKNILIVIEQYFSNSRLDKNTISSLTIEHIYPQNPALHDINRLNVKDTFELKEWTHSLGNLSIATNNEELSNFDFDRKTEILKDHSYLRINNLLNNYNDWNVENIKDRENIINNTVKQIWGTF